MPNEVRRAAVGESRCAGWVVESISCLVGVTTVVMLGNERVEYFVRSGWILGWFGEIRLLAILDLTELAHLKHHGLLDEWLVLVVSPKDPEKVVEELELSPVIQEWYKLMISNVILVWNLNPKYPIFHYVQDKYLHPLAPQVGHNTLKYKQDLDKLSSSR